MNADFQTNTPTQVIQPPPQPGQALLHFRLEALIGEGGMGMVYRAQDTKLRRPVAVKLLSSTLTSDPNRKQRLLQEARAAARISHPAVAQVYYADEEKGVTFVVMELVEGKTVRTLIENRELDLLGSIDIGIQVTEGLAKAHELGIVHRDIKPANVMLTRDNQAKILDFGLAKIVEGADIPGGAEVSRVAVTQAGMVVGTPAYMSPEQVRGLPIDFRADLFSMGVLLFEMTTGQSPFRRGNFMDSLHAVAYDETPSMLSVAAHVPIELQRIVSRCLRKRPEDRYTSAKELAQDLRVLRRDTEAGVVQRTDWWRRLVESFELWRHQPPSRLGWTAALVVALAAGLYFSLSAIGSVGVVALIVAGLLVFRSLRNQQDRLRESFVRRVSKIPEVRLIAIVGNQATVVVDRPKGQLYGRVNDYLRNANRKLFFASPMTVSILHQVPPEELQRLQAGPGVYYVRAEDEED